MKFLATVIVASSFFSRISFAQDSVLKILKDKSQIVAHVKILNMQGGMTREEGITEWSALCEVIRCYKGDAETKDKIRFRFKRTQWPG